MSALSRYGLAVIGGSTGILRLYNHATKTLIEMTRVISRPVKIVLLDANLGSSNPHPSFRFIVAYAGSSPGDLFHVKMKDNNIVTRQTKLICPPKIEIQTASLICHGKYLAIGGKGGQLLLYKLDAEKESLESAFVNGRAHAKSSVTFIHAIDDDENPNLGYALTAGRDGKYCVYCLRNQSDNERENSFEFKLIHRSSASFPQIERAYFDKQTGHFMLLGFRTSELVLWNGTTQTEIFSFDCGGVHRVWEFLPNHDVPGTGTVIWIQARSLHVLVADSVIRWPLQLGSHGREIKSMAVARTGPGLNSPLPPLIASGGEDTTIRLSIPSTRSQGANNMWSAVQCLHIMNDHVTGLQHMQWSADGRFLFSSSGREEFFVWRIRWVPQFGITALMEAAGPREDFESELRITSFDVLQLQAEGEEDRFLLTLVYSNSVVKVFLYSSSGENRAFELLGRGTYSTNCLTEVHFVVSKNRLFLVTGATDGYLAFWPLDWNTQHDTGRYAISMPSSQTTFDAPAIVHTIKWETHYAVHTSSIKTLEIKEISPDLQVLVGGGDDNSLSVTLVRLDSTAHVVSSMSIANAHASAITTVRILGSRSHSGEKNDGRGAGGATLEVASSGNDQRVKLWSVVITGDVITGESKISDIALKADQYCAVADIAAMDVLEGRTLMVGGVGMEIIENKVDNVDA